MSVWPSLGVALVLTTGATVNAQTTMTLEDAMARARTQTPAARAAAASVAEATARVEQARSRFFPRVDIIESVQRGNQPVFVFSSLLAQRRFTAANFDVQNLNHPAPETNIRTALTVQQRVYDGGASRLAVSAAELRREAAAVAQTTGTHDLAVAAARAFLRAWQLEAADRAAAAAVAAAESDLERTRRRRDVGLVTDADVLAVEVHLADVRQQQIATSGDLAVARIELAEAVGLPLDQPVFLVKPMNHTTPPNATSLIREALDTRPERQQAELGRRMAGNDRRLAQAAFLPQVGVEGSWEFNGSTWPEQRSGWTVGATIVWNVFNGLGDRARVTEAQQSELRATADLEQVERRIEVEVRAAVARVDAAQAREAAGRAALAQARESQRIVRDRYDAGLASVTDVLRAAEAVLAAEARATASETDVVMATIALNRALGRF